MPTYGPLLLALSASAVVPAFVRIALPVFPGRNIPVMSSIYGREKGRRFSRYVPEELVPHVQRWLDNGRALQDLLYQAASRISKL